MLAQPTKWITELRDTKPCTYNGYVVSNQDPSQLGRIQVRILEFYGDAETGIPDEDLPWIHQKPNNFLGGSSSFAVPDVGTLVSVEYPQSNPYFGYYGGGVINTQNNDGIFKEDYPNSYGFTDGKNYFKVNRKSEITEFKHSSGVKFTISNEGVVVDAQDKSITATCDSLTLNGNLSVSGTITSSGDTIIDGKSFLGHKHQAYNGETSAPL